MNDTSSLDDTIYSHIDYLDELTNPSHVGPLLKCYDQCTIDDKIKIYYLLYEQYDTLFYDFYLKKSSDDIFLGRYIRNTGKNMKIKINNGLILICETINTKVSKVINIYNIEDEMSLALTELEALKVFDSNIDISELESPNARLVNYTADHKLKKTKNLSRFVYYGD